MFPTNTFYSMLHELFITHCTNILHEICIKEIITFTDDIFNRAPQVYNKCFFTAYKLISQQKFPFQRDYVEKPFL